MVKEGSDLNSEDAYALAHSSTVETLHGWFDISQPTFDVHDIAAALSLKCRFGGHCKQFYSVAEHSVLVSRLMEELGGDPREGAHHDDGEGYGPDVLSPQKQLFPDVARYFATVDLGIRRHFKLPLFKTAECKRADNIAVLIEARVIMRSCGEGPHWAALDPWREDALRLARRPEFTIFCLEPEMARCHYLRRIQELEG